MFPSDQAGALIYCSLTPVQAIPFVESRLMDQNGRGHSQLAAPTKAQPMVAFINPEMIKSLGFCQWATLDGPEIVGHVSVPTGEEEQRGKGYRSGTGILPIYCMHSYQIPRMVTQSYRWYLSPWTLYLRMVDTLSATPKMWQSHYGEGDPILPPPPHTHTLISETPLPVFTFCPKMEFGFDPGMPGGLRGKMWGFPS